MTLVGAVAMTSPLTVEGPMAHHRRSQKTNPSSLRLIPALQMDAKTRPLVGRRIWKKCGKISAVSWVVFLASHRSLRVAVRGVEDSNRT